MTTPDYQTNPFPSPHMPYSSYPTYPLLTATPPPAILKPDHIDPATRALPKTQDRRPMKTPGSSTQSPTTALASSLSREPDVVVAYLFGSVARGQARPDSDLDVAVFLDPEPIGIDRIERQLDLMALLEPHTEREVQVTLLNLAPPLLAYQVIKDGIRLCERNASARITFEVNTMKRYFDIQPMLALHQQSLCAQIREVGLGRQTERDHEAVGAAQRLLARIEEPA